MTEHVYESDGIGMCELSAAEVEKVLSDNKNFVLATCANNRVTTRTMSHVHDGLTVYFQTGGQYLKTLQLAENPNAALNMGEYDLEGVAEIIGHPLDDANRFFIEKLKAKHPNAFERWSSLPNQVVIKVEIRSARCWRYINGKPVIATWHRA
ncbi:MAG: pyridoxamine 5'-phosphate oxidase family protein [Defluviitaleaceae bacterium]|nr:pyridoxamine 5'-phosphate oxidase family protein [Defluviitaleaceae bacterium]